MRPKPRVSVVIPAYQAEAHLASTLRSVLAQSYADLEVLVLDNASTDGTAGILAEWVADSADARLRVERNEQVLPLAENWNRLVSLARGDLVKVVCADDLVHPDIVALQAAKFGDDPGLALVSCRRHLIGEAGRLVAQDRGLGSGLIGAHTGPEAVRRVVRNGGNPIGEPACVMFRRADFEAVGGFDGSFSFPMDLDLWVKVLKFGGFYGMPQGLAAFRAGAASISSRATSQQYGEQRMLTSQIARDPHWRVGPGSRLVGRAGGVFAEFKHRALFVASARSNRRSATAEPLSEDLAWLG